LHRYVWAPQTRALAVKSLVALITSHCLPGGGLGGAVRVEFSLPVALKAPCFKPSTYEVKNRIQSLPRFRFNLYCYTSAAVTAVAAVAAAAVVVTGHARRT
jgi:hypothetical protein